MLPQSAGAVVIGAGVTGASVTYYLAKRGLRNVVLLEREALGSGATSKAAGGVRQQFSSAANIRLSQIALEVFQHFEEELGASPDFHQVGYLFLASTPEHAAQLRQEYELQRSLGVPVRLVSPQEAQAIVPPLYVGDLLLGRFCPTDGVAGPYEVTQAFAKRATQQGAHILEHTAVTAIDASGGHVRSVTTNHGTVETPVVVNAAGAWGAEIGKLAGVSLPVLPSRRHIFVTHPFDAVPRGIPLTIDMAYGFYFRKEGRTVLMGMSAEDEPPSFNQEVDWDFLLRLAPVASHRVPVLEKAPIMRGWAGLYDVTPDAHPILGAVPGLEGFYCAVGFSGHGFMHSPAVGQVIAELVTTGRCTLLDIRPFSVERFAGGALVKEQAVI
jgi:sarcosine oxidase subunit beta